MPFDSKTYFFEQLATQFGESECASMWKYMSIYILKHGVEESELRDTVQKLKQEYPIQYAVNEAYFYDTSLYVNEDVLIPRPETEELVDWVINDNKTKGRLKIIDIGTGSGCISCTIARHLTQAEVHANDVSKEALDVARRNANDLDLTIEFIQGDILNNDILGRTKYDIIVSNPPYIAFAEQHEMSTSAIKYEPDIALYGPVLDSLVFYKRIADLGLTNLSDIGAIYVELNALQSQSIAEIFSEAGYNIEVRRDMQGMNRMLKATQ